MSEFLPITSGCDCVSRVDAPRVFPSNGRAVPASPVESEPHDSVELSDRARLLSALKDLPDVRADLVDHARKGIASGAYDAPGVIDAVIDAAIGDLDLFA